MNHMFIKPSGGNIAAQNRVIYRDRVACHFRKQKSGFALIATISVMVLLVMIALAMLALSTTTIRSDSQNEAKAEAQANARVALMLAIGELQKHMGPDQRISANGAILSGSVNNPNWVGVWDSWVAGSPSDAPVNANYPSAASHHRTIGNASDASMRPEYTRKDDYFRAWLLSLPSTDRENINSPIDLSLNADYFPEAGDDAMILVGDGSLGDGAASQETVAAGLISMRGPSSGNRVTGRYSWWVGDQSQKASIMPDTYSQESSLSAASLLQRMQAPASMGNQKIQGVENVDDQNFGKVASVKTLDLMDPSAGGGGRQLPSQINFHSAAIHNLGILADVREGGLKQDLSTILEREIILSENADNFMLYRFNGDDERVPIQDLSAYYQLYRDDESSAGGGRGGIKYTSDTNGVLPDAIQVEHPDYGNSSGRERVLRDYTALYRSPVPIKVQFVFALGGVEITAAERQYINSQAQISQAATSPAGLTPFRKFLRDSDTHKLRVGIMPVVTLWNPYNVPLVMDKQMVFKAGSPPIAFRWKKYRAEDPNNPYLSPFMNLNLTLNGGDNSSGNRYTPNMIRLQIPGAGNPPIVFEPGEVILFSPDPEELDENFQLIRGGLATLSHVQSVNVADTGTDLDNFVVSPYSANERIASPPLRAGYPLDPNSSMGAPNQPEIYKYFPGMPFPQQGFLVFSPDDAIGIEVVQENRVFGRKYGTVGNMNFAFSVSKASEVQGTAFSFYMYDERYEATDFLRHNQLISRFGRTEPLMNDFNEQLMLQGMPGNTQIFIDDRSDAILGSQIINATRDEDVIGVLDFTMNAACEIGELAAGGYAGGRRVATRPFLHGHVISPPFIDHHGKGAMYNYGWDWQVNKINSLDESTVGGQPGTRNDYYGGGYTSEAGTTSVVQQYLPVIPPIAIAELSQAHLGGYSLANNSVVGDGYVDNIDSTDWHQFASISRGDDLKFPASTGFRRTTAFGFGGLSPSMVQAIGNSYAHPNIPADKAYTQWDRLYDNDIGPEQKTFADHSYLANKALWDNYFFSSITPKSQSVEIFESSDVTAHQVAEDFLYGGESLPNRRFIPYAANLDRSDFDDFSSSFYDFENGFADKIAGHMMVNGPFNVNSTSVEAWKVFLSSMYNKPSAYYNRDGGYQIRPSNTNDGVVVSSGSLTNGQPVSTSEIGSDPNFPVNQWSSSRVLSDQEIEELANAMVEQVKLRGPFLSLSEFINRRLDATNSELALKGAMQAALDDDSVTINAAFRTSARSLDAEAAAVIADSTDLNGGPVQFEEALEGPVAYGSTPYVDQADLLRNMGGVLTPRGDTFVIRTYGDSVDANGEVRARAWCEAIVQRMPSYIDNSDEPHLKQADLPADSSSRVMGRKFEIVSFRWLNSSEI